MICLNTEIHFCDIKIMMLSTTRKVSFLTFLYYFSTTEISGRILPFPAPPLLPRSAFFHQPDYTNVDMSSDGQWLAYISNNVISPPGIYIRKLPDGQPIFLAKATTQGRPVFDLQWAADNQTLFFRQVSTEKKLKWKNQDVNNDN